MKRSTRDLVLLVGAAAAFASAIALQVIRDRRFPRDAHQVEQVLYVRSGEALKRINVKKQQHERKGHADRLRKQRNRVQNQSGGEPLSSPFCFLRIGRGPEIADGRQQQKQCCDKIIASGRPCNGFNTERMQ